MRILHVINNGSTCGGAERLTAALVGWQRADGHRVHVLAGDRPGDGDWYADSTWPVRSSRGPARLRDFYLNTGARAALRNVLEQWHPDVVHLHTIGLLSAGALPLLRGRPTVMTVHGPELFVPGTVAYCLPARYYRGGDQVRGQLGARGLAAYAWAGAVTGPVTRRLLRRRVDLCTAPSTYLAGLVARALGPTRVIPNGLPGDRPTPPSQPGSSQPGSAQPGSSGVAGERGAGPRLVVAGRLEQTKGVQVLLAALPAVLAAYPSARLTVCGTGAMLGQLRRQAEQLGVQAAVTFAGWCPPAELSTVLAGADVAVVPSIWPESFGLVALEALAAGCAVVASDGGGLPDLVRHEQTGLLVAPGDPVALAAAVNRLLGDVALRGRLARAGVALAGTLSLTEFAAQVFAAYHEVLARATPRQPVPAPRIGGPGHPVPAEGAGRRDGDPGAGQRAGAPWR